MAAVVTDRLVVIAAHLDDAVLSAGEAIAVHPYPTIVTMFAGVPPAGSVTDYDASCGFDDSATAVEARRLEHALACESLGAVALNLDHLDGQYGEVRRWADLREAIFVDELAEVVRRLDPAMLLIPLGLGHPDHRALAGLCEQVLRYRLNLTFEVGVYEDLPYRVLDPFEAVRALELVARMLGRRLDPMPLASTTSLGPKLDAIGCYRSQLSEDIERCASVPERVWRWR